jgi:glutamate racemase
MWVPLVENNEHKGDGADYFIEKHISNILSKNKDIDTLLLACTHYPLLKEKIEKHLPSHVKLIAQGEIVAESLKDYLERHPEIEQRISKQSTRTFYTTDAAEDFNNKASIFFSEEVSARHLSL